MIAKNQVRHTAVAPPPNTRLHRTADAAGEASSRSPSTGIGAV